MNGITPLILGRGGAGHAIAKSLACLRDTDPDLGLRTPVWLPRGTNLADANRNHENAVVFIANPHGLHAKGVIEAAQSGFRAIVCEKPSAISQEEVSALSAVKTPTAILHGYRLMWGPQTLLEMLRSGELGQLIAVEGKYWQSSSADRALSAPAPDSGKNTAWKNVPELAGEYDTYLDLGSHWLDLASTFYGSPPRSIQGWRSYANADASNRDTHVQIMAEFSNAGRGFASISKTAHGASNELEIELIGTKSSASWAFLSQDEIHVGKGRDRSVRVRRAADLGSRQAPFHGLGWLEGYMEINRQILREVFLGEKGNYPRLSENLPLMRAIFDVKWNSAEN